MAIIKCKMCGGDLEILEDLSVCECEYCGTKQTVPKADNEKKIKLFERANRLRTACEFDKAAGVYESIVADYDDEAEAYWGLILCNFGIEYVDDPASGNKVPTCHRSSFDSLMDDPNFDMVMECADPVARRVYRDEAKQIEELRKRIIEVSSQEEPYDIFISYKELDDEGQRTLDSVIAQDIFSALTGKGYRVFFSRISLEDKLGIEYEPYIFAALNSAKVMLVVGTDYDYFNAVWVKNEWGRFLALIASGQKKTLIPVYKNIDAYDMPKEFRKLAAQDMGKVGAMQDLVRGVEKLLGKKGTEDSAKNQPALMHSGGPNVHSLLDRGKMALEDEDWDRAKEFFDQVLNMDSHNGEAFLGLAMADGKYRDREALRGSYISGITHARAVVNRSIIRARKFDEEINNWFAQIDKTEDAYRQNLKSQMNFRTLISARYHTVGITKEDTVLATGCNDGGECNVNNWRSILSVAAGVGFTVGLKSDGSVLAVGKNSDGQCDLNENDWKNITAIAAGFYHTVGLKANGTVIAVGRNNRGQCKLDDWTEIIAVSAGIDHTVGLTRDLKVRAVGCNDAGECNVAMWNDIIAISAGPGFTLGLRADGTVLATGRNGYGQCNVSSWSNIVKISAGYFHSVGLRADGTVVSAGSNDYGQCNVSKWADVLDISSGVFHTVGLRTNGTVVATGKNDRGQCNVSAWFLR